MFFLDVGRVRDIHESSWRTVQADLGAAAVPALSAFGTAFALPCLIGAI